MTALFDWLSIEKAATHLSITTSEAVTRDDVLELLITSRLKASVCITSTPLLVWPMVTLMGDDAAKFQLDEQRTDTYRGKSFTVDGGLLAPYRVDTVLTKRIFDLPVTATQDALSLTDSNSHFLQRLRNNPVPVGKRLCLPRGTLLEIPGTGDYFVVADDLNTPDVFCEIVIRTAALREFEARLTAFVGVSANDGVAATPAPTVNETWKAIARNRAAELISEARANDRYPSQINLGDAIANELRSAGIMGVDGKPITGAYIKRHALSGINSAQGKQLSTSTKQGKQGK